MGARSRKRHARMKTKERRKLRGVIRQQHSELGAVQEANDVLRAELSRQAEVNRGLRAVIEQYQHLNPEMTAVCSRGFFGRLRFGLWFAFRGRSLLGA